MLASQRRSRILEELRRSGAVRVSALVERLGVSDMTVRRDLEVLAQQGKLQKVHGGAILPGGRSTEEPGFAAKSNRENAEKLAIACGPTVRGTGYGGGLVRGHHDVDVRPAPA